MTSPLRSEVRSLRKARDARSTAFGSDLFSDPAWDILLELFAAGLEQRRIRITDLPQTIAPPSTVARWVGVLCGRGLIVSTGFAHSATGGWIELSPEATAKMESYFLEFGRRRLPLLTD